MFVFGCLPIPLFFDEVVLLVATGILYIAHRDIVVETWRRTRVEIATGHPAKIVP